MAFSSFQFRVSVDVDSKEIYQWCSDTFATGYWGQMFNFVGGPSTYCFFYEKDATLFLLRWPDK